MIRLEKKGATLLLTYPVFVLLSALFQKLNKELNLDGGWSRRC